MKNVFKLLALLLMTGLFCLPALAQDDETPVAPSEDAAQADADKPAPKPAPKKPARKKKPAKKKKPAEPVSEYKFSSGGDMVPAYKFDKRANPILKPVKRKKPAKKGAGVKASTAPVAPKLKPAKSIGAEDAPAEGDQKQQDAE